MDRIFRVFALFVVLLSAAMATNVNVAYQGSDPTWHFNTDMQLTTDFTLSLVSGGMAGGNPGNILSGDSVCSGSVVHVTPVPASKWATSSLDIVSLYPTCGGGFCPAMIASGGLSGNKGIAWLPAATFNEHKTFGDGNDFSQDSARFSELGTFYNEPVTYNNATGVFNPNKEGGANIFCKGNLQIKDGGTSIANNPMPSSGGADITLTSSGSHTIATSLNGVNCFGAVVKHPTNQVDNPPWFFFYYFTKNVAPPIPAVSGTKTISITVQPSGGNCAFHDIQVAASSSPSDADLTMVQVRFHNDGDAVKITSVASSNAGFTVSDFPIGLCAVLGFPGGLCPASNGFNENIAAGGEKNLYVLIEKQAGGSGGTTLTFTAQTSSSTCGGSGSCTSVVNDLNGPAFCAITPASLTYGTQEVAQFLVACEDLSHNPIACTGSNWFWANGLTGGFVDKDNTHAIAYPTSAPGSSGTLRYATTTGLAECFSNINVVTPKYECEFIPPNANMNYNGVKGFLLNCFESGSSKKPDTADYQLIDGLVGSLGGGSTSGVTYTAPNLDSSGKLLGFGKFNSATPPILGAVALAPIKVSGNSNNSSGCTGPNCGNNPGDSKWCRIGTQLQNVFSGYKGWVSIQCGEHGNETCVSAVWWTDPSTVASTSGGSNTGTFVTITGGKGTTGRVYAYVNGDSNHNCFTDFVVGERQCWEIT